MTGYHNNKEGAKVDVIKITMEGNIISFRNGKEMRSIVVNY